jgi:WD40 repeat protein
VTISLAASEDAPPSNPYPGLRSFRDDDGKNFFGRDGQSDALMACMVRTRFLAIVGSSGTGKSSLARAGLVASLRGGYFSEGGSVWAVADLRPGSGPLDALARAIQAAADTVRSRSSDGLAQALSRLRATSKASLCQSSFALADLASDLRTLTPPLSLLILVDQFEELFDENRPTTFDERAAFVKLLIEGTRRPDVPLYVAITMRSDFLGHCDRFRDLPESVSDGQYLIPRMTRAEWRTAIEGPARLNGVTISNRLVQHLINEMSQDADQLPSLQHGLRRAWERSQAPPATGEMDSSHYDLVGGLAGELSAHADETLALAVSRFTKAHPTVDGAETRAAQIVKRVFQALTDGPKADVKRSCSLKTLATLVEATVPEVATCLAPFWEPERAFLVTSQPYPLPSANTDLEADIEVEVIHECVLRKWKHLRTWSDEEQDSAGNYRLLTERTSQFEKGGGALTGALLQQMLAWWKERRPNDAWAARYGGGLRGIEKFLEASRTAQEEADRQTEIRLRAEASRRVERGLRIGMLVGLILVSATAVAALMAWNRAQTYSRRADENYATADYNYRRAFGELMSAAAGRLFAEPATLIDSLLVAAAQQRVGSSDVARTASTREVLSQGLALLPDHTAQLPTPATCVAFTNDKHLVSAAGNKVTVWDDNRKPIREFTVPGTMRSMVIARRASTVAALQYDRVSFVGIAPGPVSESTFPCNSGGISIDDTGQLAAGACSGAAVLFRKDTKGKWSQSKVPGTRGALTADISANGTELGYITRNLQTNQYHFIVKRVGDWKVATDIVAPRDSTALNYGRELLPVAFRTGSREEIIGSRFSTSVSLALAAPAVNEVVSDAGDLVATVSQDRLVRLWRTSDGAELMRTTLAGSVTKAGLAFSPDGRSLAVVIGKEPGMLISLSLNQQGGGDVSVTGDGAFLVTHSRIVSIEDGRDLASVGALQFGTQLSRDAKTRANRSGGGSSVSVSRPPGMGERLIHLKTSFDRWRLTPDGKYIIDVMADQLAIFVDAQQRSRPESDGRPRAFVTEVATGRPISEIKIDVPSSSTGVAFCVQEDNLWVPGLEDGKQVLLRYPMAGGSPDKARLPPDIGSLRSLSVDRSGNHFAIGLSSDRNGSGQPSVMVGSLAQGAATTVVVLGQIPLASSTTALAWSDDGQILAGVSDDGIVHFWSVDGRSQSQPTETGRLTGIDGVTHIGFSPTDRFVVLSGRFGVALRLWREEDLLSEVCRRIPGGIGMTDWKRLLGEDSFYTPVCTETALSARSVP